MKKIVSVIFVIVTFTLSACATYTSVKDVDKFLAGEKAKGFKPVTEEYKIISISPSIAPIEGDSSARFSTASDLGVARVLLPVAYDVGRIAIAGALSVKDAVDAKKPEHEKFTEKDILYQVSAVTDYGRFVEVSNTGLPDPNSPSLFVEAVQTIGIPPLPCKIYTKYCTRTGEDIKEYKKGGIHRIFTKKLRYSVTYKTEIPEKVVPEQTSDVCTQKMAEEHFGKVIKIMENR